MVPSIKIKLPTTSSVSNGTTATTTVETTAAPPPTSTPRPPTITLKPPPARTSSIATAITASSKRIKIEEGVSLPSGRKDKKDQVGGDSKSNSTCPPPSSHHPNEDDEDCLWAPTEEQFILRMPPGKGTDSLREAVQKRQGTENLSMTFSDSRRATIQWKDETYLATLVDLPNIIESQKTIDNKTFYKIADISQMLIAEPANGDTHAKGPIAPEALQWSHGLSAPMKHVRKRRFRKTINKRAVESVERAVERLLALDLEAMDVKYEVVDPKDAMAAAQAMEDGADDEDTEDILPGDDDESVDDFDALEAELDAALEEKATSPVESSDEEEEEEDDDEGEDGTGAEKSIAHLNQEKLNILKDEINDLQLKITEKEAQAQLQPNPIMRSRFESMLIKLRKELEFKQSQYDELDNGAEDDTSR